MNCWSVIITRTYFSRYVHLRMFVIFQGTYIYLCSNCWTMFRNERLEICSNVIRIELFQFIVAVCEEDNFLGKKVPWHTILLISKFTEPLEFVTNLFSRISIFSQLKKDLSLYVITTHKVVHQSNTSWSTNVHAFL